MSRLIKVALKHPLEFQYQNCEQASIASGLQTEVFSSDQTNFAVIYIYDVYLRVSFDLYFSLCVLQIKTIGFTHFGLYMQDYGGPIGFRIITRHPKWLEWQIVQNANAYEIGFTSAWDGLRALWNNRTPETEKALYRFFNLKG